MNKKMLQRKQIMLITGTRKGIGQYLARYYAQKGFQVIGCSRGAVGYKLKNYQHFCLDISDEEKVNHMFTEILKTYKHLDVVINNAGIASMNHALLTPSAVALKIVKTNFIGTFTVCREAAKLMKIGNYGRIINFVSIAVPLKLEGEAVYAASKAAVISLTQILARELIEFGITVNAIGPTPIKTDMIHAIAKEKIMGLISRQAIKRMGELRDISNVIDFFIKPESDFITGQVIYLGGV